MKNNGISQFSMGVGIIAGTLIGLSLFVLVQNGQFQSTKEHQPIKLDSVQMASLDFTQILKKRSAKEKEASGLDEFLTLTTKDVAGRHVTVVEIGRESDAQRLLNPLLDWQEKSTGKRDIIVYLAPVHEGFKEERNLARVVKSILRQRDIQFPLLNRRTSYVFHSQIREKGYSLENIVNYAHTLGNKPQHGLAQVRLTGSIEKMAWIRTTLSRWQFVKIHGIRVGEYVVGPSDIAASLIDPSRNTITHIELISRTQFNTAKRAAA